ncbi:hypothetical protein [Bradyrhizobium sp.]|uniref:hypothetical protein n=1 Tax=Bradyrhizobium sp. TaxID=376 RepID=UPI003BAF26B0
MVECEIIDPRHFCFHHPLYASKFALARDVISLPLIACPSRRVSIALDPRNAYSRNGSAYSLTTAAGTRQRTASRSALRPRAKNLFVRPRSCRRFIGALLRRLREAARTMTAGQRAAKLSGSHRSLALVDAVLEFADDPWMAGVDIFNPNELQIFEEARERRLRDLHGPLLDQVAERENTLEEVQMVIDVARGDVQHASNLPGPAFEAIAAPIEKRVNAPWILSDRKTVCTVMPDGTAEYHVGTPDELRDGVQFPDLQAYLAARAAA